MLSFLFGHLPIVLASGIYFGGIYHYGKKLFFCLWRDLGVVMAQIYRRSNGSHFPMVLWVWWVADKGKKGRAAQAWLWELQSQPGKDISSEHWKDQLSSAFWRNPFQAFCPFFFLHLPLLSFIVSLSFSISATWSSDIFWNGWEIGVQKWNWHKECWRMGENHSSLFQTLFNEK